MVSSARLLRLRDKRCSTPKPRYRRFFLLLKMPTFDWPVSRTLDKATKARITPKDAQFCQYGVKSELDKIAHLLA